MKKQLQTTKPSAKPITEAILEKKLDEKFRISEKKFDLKLEERFKTSEEKFDKKFEWFDLEMNFKLQTLAETIRKELQKSFGELKDELFTKIDRIAGRIDDHDANDTIRDNDIDELGMRVKRLEHAKN